MTDFGCGLAWPGCSQQQPWLACLSSTLLHVTVKPGGSPLYFELVLMEITRQIPSASLAARLHGVPHWGMEQCMVTHSRTTRYKNYVVYSAHCARLSQSSMAPPPCRCLPFAVALPLTPVLALMFVLRLRSPLPAPVPTKSSDACLLRLGDELVLPLTPKASRLRHRSMCSFNSALVVDACRNRLQIGHSGP